MKDLFDLSDRIVLVTGGSSGMGKAIAEAMCTYGATVIVSSIDAEGCTNIASQMTQSGGKAYAIPCDVSLPKDMDALLNEKVKAVLAIYDQRMQEEALLMQSLGKDGMARRDEFLLPVGQEVAQFLFTLATAAKSKSILEVGTFYGYSTVWLAAAAQQNGGKVISLEIDEKKVAYAKEQISKVGLSEVVEFRVGDAVQSIQSASETFDFVLLDIWKELYLPCFHAILPKLLSSAFLIADNIILPPFHKKDMEAYRAVVKASDAFDSVLLPIGSGVEVSKRRT